MITKKQVTGLPLSFGLYTCAHILGACIPFCMTVAHADHAKLGRAQEQSHLIAAMRDSGISETKIQNVIEKLRQQTQKKEHHLPLSSSNKSSNSNTQPDKKKQTKQLFSRNGLRIGLGVGTAYKIRDAATKSDLNRLSAKTVGNPAETETSIELVPHVELGYHFQNGVYIGVLGTYDYNPQTIKFYRIIGQMGVNPTIQHMVIDGKRHYSLSALFKLGYRVRDRYMIYGLVGPEFSKWKLNVTMMANQNSLSSKSYAYTSTGVKFGLGLEWLATTNVALALDWSQTVYTRDKIGNSTMMGFRSKQNAITLRLSYLF